MKKNNKKYIYILLIIVLILSTLLLGFNSFINLSYVRKEHNGYTFMLPKEINYIDEYYQGILNHDKILSSSVIFYPGTFELAKGLISTYKFYNSNIEIVSNYEKKIDNKSLYLITKKLTYFDNNKTTYMFSYIYEIDEDNQFVISVECETLEDLNYFIKRLKKTAKSVILY